MFLNMEASVTSWSPDRQQCCLVFTENPLTDFIELPANLQGLQCSQAMSGALRGALEMLNIRTDCKFTKDMLRGDPFYEITVRLLEHQNEEYPFKDD